MPKRTVSVNPHAEACLARTNWYNYISGFYFLASVGGSSIGSLLLSHYVFLLNGLSIACYILAACVVANISSHCGLDEKNDEGDALIGSDPDDVARESARSSLTERLTISNASDTKATTQIPLPHNYASCTNNFSVLYPTHRS